MLQNADVQRRLNERNSDDITHRLRDSEHSLTRYQVISDVHSTHYYELQNADVQRRLNERNSDDITHRLRDSEHSLTRYQVISDVQSKQNVKFEKHKFQFHMHIASKSIQTLLKSFIV